MSLLMQRKQMLWMHLLFMTIKSITVSTIIWAVFNIDHNHKCFLSSTLHWFPLSSSINSVILLHWCSSSRSGSWVLQMSGNIQRSLDGSVPIEAERRGRTRRPLRANSSGVVEIRSPLSRSTGRCQCPSLIKYWRSWKEGSSRRWVNINGSLVFLACRKWTRVWFGRV